MPEPGSGWDSQPWKSLAHNFQFDSLQPPEGVVPSRGVMELAVHTLGCKLNQAETSAVGESFREVGFEVVSLKEGGDVVFINTCTVTERADQECRKLVRRSLRVNPNAFVIVTGCYAQLQPEKIASIDGVDLVLGNAEKHRALELAGDLSKRDTPYVVVSDIAKSSDFGVGYTREDEGRVRAFLKVQDGCDYTCSFCTIPLARGPSRSQSIEECLRQARGLVMNGFREIVLTGVNVGDFGKHEDTSLLKLLEGLHEIKGLSRLKISSIEPNLLTDEIIDMAASSDRLMPHFHIPLQSGSDHILGEMRRRYRRDLYEKRVKRLVEVMPHCAIGVDVITGFPGETEAHFQETLDFIDRLPVAYLHVFTYSERENTPAATRAEVVSRQERARRTRALRMLSEKKREAFMRAHLDSTRPVLFEQQMENGKLTGLTDNYIRVDVDGEDVQVGTILSTSLSRVHGERCQGWIEASAACSIGV